MHRLWYMLFGNYRLKIEKLWHIHDILISRATCRYKVVTTNLDILVSYLVHCRSSRYMHYNTGLGIVTRPIYRPRTALGSPKLSPQLYELFGAFRKLQQKIK